MTYNLKNIYPRYFQKSRSFLSPALGLKKDTRFPFVQCYLQWEGMYEIQDQNIILVYEERKDDKLWKQYMLEKLMNNPMFNQYHPLKDGHMALSFDLHCIKDDYTKVLEGKYSKLSTLLKTKIREFYGFNSPEWMYMESFLFPKNYIKMYSGILDVDEEHIRHTGELCDLPDIEKETLKTKTYAKINDVDSLLLEQGENIQDDPR